MATRRLAETLAWYFEKRRLPTAAFFHEERPTQEEVVRNVKLPFAARYVEEALAPDARQLSPLSVLLERAEQLIAVAADIEEVRAMLDDISTAAGVPRRPPGRSDSANPSQEFCKSRIHSAK